MVILLFFQEQELQNSTLAQALAQAQRHGLFNGQPNNTERCLPHIFIHHTGNMQGSHSRRPAHMVRVVRSCSVVSLAHGSLGRVSWNLQKHPDHLGNSLVQDIYHIVDVSQHVYLLSCTILYCVVVYCIVLYCIVLQCTVLYCTVLYCTVPYYIVLYCIVLYVCMYLCVGSGCT